MAQSKLQNTDNPYQGSYPSVFKKIDTTDVQVNPFQSYKTWTVYSGSLTSSILPLQGVYTDVNFLPAIGTTLTFNDAANIDGSLQSITYFSINHLFYKYKDQPYNTFGPTNLNRTKKFLFQTASIFSIPLNKIGQGIKPASFNFTSSVSGSFSSDRYGNIIDTAFNTASIISQVKLYEGFNEYFDINRISYISNNVTYIPGVPTTNGQQRTVGLAAWSGLALYLLPTICTDVIAFVFIPGVLAPLPISISCAYKDCLSCTWVCIATCSVLISSTRACAA